MPPAGLGVRFRNGVAETWQHADQRRGGHRGGHPDHGPLRVLQGPDCGSADRASENPGGLEAIVPINQSVLDDLSHRQALGFRCNAG